jgi:hypothetical protein
MFKKAKATVAARRDPTKTKSFRSGVSSATKKVRDKLNAEWGDKVKKAKAAAKARLPGIQEMLVNEVAIPAAIGTATSLGLDYGLEKVTMLKGKPMVKRGAKVLGAVGLSVLASLSKKTRPYAAGFAIGPLAVVGSDIGRQKLKVQISGADDVMSAEDQAAYAAQIAAQTMPQLSGAEEQRALARQLSGPEDELAEARAMARSIGR